MTKVEERETVEEGETTIVNVRGKLFGVDYDVYCGRKMPGKFDQGCGLLWSDETEIPAGYFGNPFHMVKDREDAIFLFTQLFISLVQKANAGDPEASIFINQVKRLKGKRLGCWCKPGICHCDVYVNYLDGGSNGQ